MKLPVLIAPLVVFFVLAITLAVAIAVGGPKPIGEMSAINEPFKAVDFSDLPAIKTYRAADGTNLAYRAYPASGTAKGSVILVHGSSASGASMHPLAKAYQATGLHAYSLDMRGHGASGEKGQIHHIGQLEEDVRDFIKQIEPARPLTMTGLSAGGGFTLRFAGSQFQTLVDRYVLLAPFLSQDDITYRPDSGGWVSIGMPRIIGLSILNQMGITKFNDLPVTRFALNDYGRKHLTPEYSFALAVNFRPLSDFSANMRAVKQSIQIIAGTKDEAFFAEKYADSIKAQGLAWPVTLIPGVGHIGISLDPKALAAITTL